MKRLSRELFSDRWGADLPERVVQFGEGRFLRGFIDWMIHRLNREGLFRGRVVAVQPTPHGKLVPKINAQDGLYTVVLRGLWRGEVIDREEVVSSISRGINPYENWDEVLALARKPEIRFVFSNTTEAGITYREEDYIPNRSPLSFPGKLTAFLYERFRVFNGAEDAGLAILPFELVDENGRLLKEMVERKAEDWNLPRAFVQWLNRHNRFFDTLSDRIVTGYPVEEADSFTARLGYEDQLLTVGEPYHFLVIDGDKETAEMLPLHRAGLQVHWGDVRSYRLLKVRILNGAHTMMFALGYLCGWRTVLEVMRDDLLARMIRRGIYEEILPTLDNDPDEGLDFAGAVTERFQNPFIRHFLTDIGLNAVSKYRVRLLPTLLYWIKQKRILPPITTLALAALILYYHQHLGESDVVRDRSEVLNCFRKARQSCDTPDDQTFLRVVLGDCDLWERDLNRIPHLPDEVGRYVSLMSENGVRETVARILNEGAPIIPSN